MPNESLHPHWHTAEGISEPESHTVMPAVAGVTVSRRPAAVVGIGVVLVLGGFLFQAQDILFPAQITENEQEDASSSAAISASVSVFSEPAAVLTEPASQLPAEVAASSVAFAGIQNDAVPSEPLPNNPYTYQPVATAEIHPAAPLYPESTFGKGKGKPPEQPSSGLPLWLLLSASGAGIWLYAKRVARNVLLYK